jgi:hypothetical protein
MKYRRTVLPPFGLDMSFREALARFVMTDPREVDQAEKQSKKKKPPGRKRKRKPPGDRDQSASVVDLRQRRMRKRNTGR